MLLQLGSMTLWVYKEYDKTNDVAMVTAIVVSVVLVSLDNWENYVLTSSHVTSQSHRRFLVRLRRKLRKRRTKLSLMMSLWKIVFTVGESGSR